MAVKLSAIISTLKSLRGDELADKVLWRLLIDGLSRQQQTAYGLIVRNKQVSSMEVAQHLGKPQNHTDNILHRLAEYGLIESEPVRGERGLHLVWREKK